MFICILYKPCIISWQFSDVYHQAVDSANDNQRDQRSFSDFVLNSQPQKNRKFVRTSGKKFAKY